MDPSSVITQVTPDNNDASHLFTVQKGNGVQQKGKLTYLDSKYFGAHKNNLKYLQSNMYLFRNEKKVQFLMLHYLLPR